MFETVSDTNYTAAEAGSHFLGAAKEAIEREFPEASNDARATASANLALSMAIEHLSMSVAGRVENSPLSAALIKFVQGEKSSLY